jgi:hypothetical protein
MPTCPKCQAQMEEGFIVDEWHRLFRTVSTWVPGDAGKLHHAGCAAQGQKDDQDEDLAVHQVRLSRRLRTIANWRGTEPDNAAAMGRRRKQMARQFRGVAPSYVRTSNRGGVCGCEGQQAAYLAHPPRVWELRHCFDAAKSTMDRRIHGMERSAS